jgi:hypothetical protein
LGAFADRSFAHVRSGYDTRGSTLGEAVAGRDDETGVRRSG